MPESNSSRIKINNHCIKQQHRTDDTDGHETKNTWYFFSIQQDIDIKPECGIDWYR